MKKAFALIITLVLTALPLAGCAVTDATTPAPNGQEAVAGSTTPAEEDVNFRLLISDEPNDIGDFEELWVTISGIGFVQGDDEGVIEVAVPTVDVNLVAFQGLDAIDAWEGYVPEGDYTKIFLYVDEVWGFLVPPEGEEEVGEAIEIKLPSNKLQLKLPFTVGDEPEGEAAEFVFDITVHSAGNSGQYILKPQLTESGEGKQYRLLEHTEERIRKGKPDWAGKPDGAGKPDWAGKPDDSEETADAGEVKETGKPEWAGQQGGKHSTDEDGEEPEES